MSDLHAQRVDTLTRAAQAKRRAAITRAEAGLRRLVKANTPVNFRSVAKAGGVSLDFLYRNDELRRRIEQLRAQQNPTPPRSRTTAPAEAGSVVASLTAKLRDTHAENLDLRAQLAAAHGELLLLRRASTTVSNHAIVTDASSTQ